MAKLSPAPLAPALASLAAQACADLPGRRSTRRTPVSSQPPLCKIDCSLQFTSYKVAVLQAVAGALLSRPTAARSPHA